MAQDREAPRSAVRTLGLRFAHLAALSAFAVAQPLFGLLGDTADFFAVRGSTRWDIVLFGLGVVLVPPVALVAVEALAWLVSRSLAGALHLVFVAGLAGIVAIQALERTTELTSTRALIGLGAAAAAAAALLYWRVPVFRSFLTVLAPASLLFLGSFLLLSPAAELARAEKQDVALARVTARAPVVVVVFDELPTSSLLNERGEIDADRYPNFAELAQMSTWYRNATTVSYSTTRAVPAILTGSRTDAGKPPVFDSYPRNIFTLLGGDYRMNVVETATRLCPAVVCKRDLPAAPPAEEPVEAPAEAPAPLYSDVGIVYLHLLAPPALEEGLPPITDRWMNFGREDDKPGKLLEEALAERKGQGNGGKPGARRGQGGKRYNDGRTRLFTRFLRGIEPGEEPSLNLIHAGFPHGPWTYFPSGRQSTIGAVPAPGRDDATDTWTNPFLAQQAYQRHLLQTGYTDRLVGRLLTRLRRTGLLDEAVVVVTADHGVSFRAGESRRGATPENFEDIAFIPLFVKAPGQREGAVVDDHVETIDVLPTIADLLDIRIPWEVEGRSAISAAPRELIRVQTRPRDWEGGEASAPVGELVDRHEAVIARRAELFGSGDWERVFLAVPYRALVGRRLGELAVSGPAGDSGTITDEVTRQFLTALDPELPFVASPLQGSISGPGARPGRALAVAVNGRIAAVATTHDASGTVRFSALPSESAFRPGANTVELLWVDGDAGAERLTRIASG